MDFARWLFGVGLVSGAVWALDRLYAPRAAWSMALIILIGVTAARDPRLESLQRLMAAVYGGE